MKTVLVPFSQDGLPDGVLETACAFARRFGSYIEGAPFDVLPAEYVAVDLFGGGWVPPTQNQIEQTNAINAARFADHMAKQTIPACTGAPSGLSWAWRANQGKHASIAELSRAFDVTVFGRPSPPASPTLRVMLEATLFEGGRAILVAPPRPAGSLGDNVVIAWNCSTETARTVALALPALTQAKTVTVLTILGGTVSGPTGADLVRNLRVHGITASDRVVEPRQRTTGEAILEEATDLGCDLLIKGAYTQSRFRQMIFGGATSHILEHTNLPVFMAH